MRELIKLSKSGSRKEKIQTTMSPCQTSAVFTAVCLASREVEFRVESRYGFYNLCKRKMKIQVELGRTEATD